MHGISKRKHEHLVEALLLLEQLLINEQQLSEEELTGASFNEASYDVLSTKKAVHIPLYAFFT